MDRKEYYRHLGRIQNHNSLVDIVDIMTITGLMDDAQKINHLARYAEQVQDGRALTWLEDTFNV